MNKRSRNAERVATLRPATPLSGSKAYSRRLAYMYSQLRRKQQDGADFSKMDDFLNKLSVLVSEEQQTKKAA